MARLADVPLGARFHLVATINGPGSFELANTRGDVLGTVGLDDGGNLYGSLPNLGNADVEAIAVPLSVGDVAEYQGAFVVIRWAAPDGSYVTDKPDGAGTHYTPALFTRIVMHDQRLES